MIKVVGAVLRAGEIRLFLCVVDIAHQFSVLQSRSATVCSRFSVTSIQVIWTKLQVICTEILRDFKGFGVHGYLNFTIKNHRKNRVIKNANHSKSPFFDIRITSKNS